jgi:F-box-like
MEYEDLKQIIKVVNKSESDFPDDESGWSLIPENVLVRILKLLSAKDILSCSEVCKRWNFISNDSLLWKYKFTSDFKVDKNIPRRPGKVIEASSYVFDVEAADIIPLSDSLLHNK